MSNKKFEYNPERAYSAIVTPASTSDKQEHAQVSQESLVQKNVRFKPSQLKQIAFTAIEQGKDQSALLRDVWDEYYRAYNSKD